MATGQLMSMASVVVSWSLCKTSKEAGTGHSDVRSRIAPLHGQLCPTNSSPQLLPAFQSKLFPLITAICDRLKVRATKTLVGPTSELAVVSTPAVVHIS